MPLFHGLSFDSGVGHWLCDLHKLFEFLFRFYLILLSVHRPEYCPLCMFRCPQRPEEVVESYGSGLELPWENIWGGTEVVHILSFILVC